MAICRVADWQSAGSQTPGLLAFLAVAGCQPAIRQSATLRYDSRRTELDAALYRIRVGDYRLGLVFDGGTMTFVRCLNRREIYRYFP